MPPCEEGAEAAPVAVRGPGEGQLGRLGNRTLIGDAYQRIKQMILQQKVAPGQRLVYTDLCKALGMSRTPIISALTRLEEEGFLVSEPFRGFSVKPIDLKEAWDLFGVREALETYAVEQAIQSGDDEGFRALEAKLLSHEQYNPGYYDRKRFKLDADFHIQIAAMSRNRVLERLLRSNLEHVYLRYRLEGADPARMTPAVQEHHELLERMKKRDIMGSVDIMRLHIRRARENILASLSREAEPIAL